MESTYQDVTTKKVRVRHKPEWDRTPFNVLSNEWQVTTFGELLQACKDAKTRDGGTIFIDGRIPVEDTVSFPPYNTVVQGGTLEAVGTWADQAHFTDVKNAENVVFIGTEWDGKKNPVLCCPIGSSQNIAFIDTVHHSCKTGPAANKSRRLAFVGVHSHNHTTWHGINPGQDEECELVAVLGCNLHDNGGYGLDYHGSKMEWAGNRVWNNGKLNNDGSCVKFPRGKDIWGHNNYLQSPVEGLGLVRIYETKGQLPKDIYVYRNEMEGTPHFRIPAGLTIYHADNHFNRDIVVAGGGNLVYNETLAYLPDEPGDVVTPPPPPPPPPPDDGKQWTEEEIISIVDGRIREAFLAIANDI